MIGSQSSTEVTCSESRDCSLSVNGSELSITGFFTVSVVASNGIGSGETVTSSPGQGVIYLCLK